MITQVTFRSRVIVITINIVVVAIYGAEKNNTKNNFTFLIISKTVSYPEMFTLYFILPIFLN